MCTEVFDKLSSARSFSTCIDSCNHNHKQNVESFYSSKTFTLLSAESHSLLPSSKPHHWSRLDCYNVDFSIFIWVVLQTDFFHYNVFDIYHWFWVLVIVLSFLLLSNSLSYGLLHPCSRYSPVEDHMGYFQSAIL